MPRTPKTMLRLMEQHPDKIESISCEQGRHTKDGYWLYLHRGWQRDGVHCVHEWNMRDLVQGMREVEPCDCWSCQGLPEPELGFDGLPIAGRGDATQS